MQKQPLLLARQPIYDASLQVVAFELLHRSVSPEGAAVEDGDEASSRVLLTAFGAGGIPDVTDGKPVFINFTDHLIVNPPPVDPRQLVVEVLEDVNVTDELLAGIHRLRRRGYRIALDDFTHSPERTPLIELADIVKLDVLALGEVQLRAEVRQLRNYPVRLLAEKIESWEMFNHCIDLGFSYFQGYFLARPQLVRGRRLEPARATVLALIARLARSGIRVAELADTIQTDPILSINLIRLVNSPLYRRAVPLESLRDAILTLGLERVRGWCSLLVLSRLDGKPSELTRIAMWRARFCELLGGHCDRMLAGRCFTMGILSTLDAFMDQTLESVLTMIALSKELHDALLAHRGTMGFVLATALACETADWDHIPWEQLERSGIDQATLEQYYLESLRWIHDTLGQTGSGIFSTERPAGD